MLSLSLRPRIEIGLKGRIPMPSYLLQFSYTPETLAGFIKRPTDRREAIAKLAAQIGGKIVGSWFTFGDYDAVAIIEGPAIVDAAASSMIVSASGAFKAFKTTLLLSVEEGMAAMKKAGSIKYKPPTAKK
jgi:uncharacterized protein with GYD domain